MAFLLLVAACTEAPPPDAEALGPAERGRAVVTQNGCIACHAFDARRGVGPGWGGIYGTTRSLQDGRSVVVDDAYLRRAMLEPAADVVDGFDNVMIPAAVNAEQLADIIALIRELADATTQ